jgi:hypothetical protein
MGGLPATGQGLMTYGVAGHLPSPDVQLSRSRSSLCSNGTYDKPSGATAAIHVLAVQQSMFKLEEDGPPISMQALVVCKLIWAQDEYNKICG